MSWQRVMWAPRKVRISSLFQVLHWLPIYTWVKSKVLFLTFKGLPDMGSGSSEVKYGPLGHKPKLWPQWSSRMSELRLIIFSCNCNSCAWICIAMRMWGWGGEYSHMEQEEAKFWNKWKRSREADYFPITCLINGRHKVYTEECLETSSWQWKTRYVHAYNSACYTSAPQAALVASLFPDPIQGACFNL